MYELECKPSGDDHSVPKGQSVLFAFFLVLPNLFGEENPLGHAGPPQAATGGGGMAAPWDQPQQPASGRAHLATISSSLV